MIFRRARKRKTPRTQRVRKFLADEKRREIIRKDIDSIYEYRF
jgi:hypothetical protein